MPAVSHSPIARLRAWGRAALLGLALLAPAQALRIVDYNLLNYPGPSGSARAVHFRTILEPLGADVIVAQEIVSPTGPAQFLEEVLDVMEPDQWATVPFIDGNDSDASLFYKPERVQFLEQWAFYPNPAQPLRYIHVYRLKPADYESDACELRIYTGHLKASTGYEEQRLAECIGIRDSMNAMPAGTRALICGDLNFYTQASEPGYAKLLEDQPNNVGRVYDLLPAGDWHDGEAFAPYHTQSPCRSGTCASGAATGGMDDRFDFILPTYNLGTGQGLAVIPGTCVPVGNDGLHLNLNITDPPVIPEGGTYAGALQLASDHLPLRIDLQVPARISADAALAFDPVIVGAPAPAHHQWIGNTAEAPADSLDCDFSPPPGFGAPGGLTVAAGEAQPAEITMLTATAGPRVGTLIVASDAPDDPAHEVELTGAVLDHAAASLDSLTALLAATVDFGEHEPGGFEPQSVRVFNLGYDEYQARLWLNAATLTGADDRFLLVDGFAGHLIAGAGHQMPVAFDDQDADPDSTYTATLVLGSSDEPLPGALPQPDLEVTLRARVLAGQAGVDGPASVMATRLHDPSPSPLTGATVLRLDVARAVDGSIAIFDPSGRRAATLHRGILGAGSHALTWDGRSDDGAAAAAGMYFVRFSAPGLRPQTVRLVVVR
jgi:hypothetical protein